MRKATGWLATALIVLLLLAGCGLIGGETGPVEPPAATMLPTLDDYNTVEGQTLTRYISTASGGAALLSGQPQLAATIAAIDEIVQCYQEVGAVRARVYNSQADPLTAGAVAIADRNAVRDPANFFRCVSPLPGPSARAPGDFEPCTANYTLEKEENVFYVLYAGTKPEVCQAFCSQLEGCTAHP